MYLGIGGLGMSIEGPGKVDIKCFENPGGTCRVAYNPTEPGTYQLSVKYADEHIPGCFCLSCHLISQNIARCYCIVRCVWSVSFSCDVVGIATSQLGLFEVANK